jgi:hypothetical protein
MLDEAFVLSAAGAAMTAAIPPGRRGRISVNYHEPGLGISITQQDTGAWLAVVYDTRLNRLLGAETIATFDAATTWAFSRTLSKTETKDPHRSPQLAAQERQEKRTQSRR